MKRVLIVITDGESNDRKELPAAAALAERKNIVRFAIGVSCIFDNQAFTPMFNAVEVGCTLKTYQSV